METDMTPKQREKLNTARIEFERRKQNGEDNIWIKFVNGIPKIVQKNWTSLVSKALFSVSDIETFMG